MKTPINPYHQPETIFVGKRQQFCDAGLSPDDPVVQSACVEEGPVRLKAGFGEKKETSQR